VGSNPAGGGSFWGVLKLVVAHLRPPLPHRLSDVAAFWEEADQKWTEEQQRPEDHSLEDAEENQTVRVFGQNGFGPSALVVGVALVVDSRIRGTMLKKNIINQ
jgi:hypothetical protein